MKRSITAQAAAFVEAARFEYGTKAETRAAILAKLAAILAETGNFSPPPASKRMKEGERA